jgi:PAS domain S-box-containing protein
MTDHRPRIVHVDDDPSFLELTRVFVERFAPEFRYETSTDPEEACRRLKSDEVDCLVSDYDMPGVDGLELLAAVRVKQPTLPFVLFTGKGSEEIASEAISAGVTDYLRKSSEPGRFELLVHSVRNAVQRHRSDRLVKQVYDAIHQVDEGVSLVDGDGRFLYVNRSYAEAFGYEPEELVGEPWSKLYRNEADVATIEEEVMADLSPERPWQGRTLHPRRDGRLFYVDHHLGVSADGLVVCRVKDLGDVPDPAEATSPILADGGRTDAESQESAD